MLDFKKIGLEDIELLRSFIQYKVDRNCDCTIGGTIMWRDYFDTSYAIYEDMMFLRVNYVDGNVAYCFPLAKDKVRALSILKDYVFSLENELEFCTITEKEKQIIEEVFKGYNLSQVKDRDWFDYIYNSEDMVTFAGRKYSGERNHINKFNKLYENNSFEIIDETNIEKAKNFFRGFLNHNDKESDTYAAEAVKVIEVLDNYEKYKLLGGMLLVDGKVVGMSMGEIIGDTLFVHIEKANTNYQGVYQVLVKSFASSFVTEDIKYINREEDVGDEGLRRSKMSYHPIELIEKSHIRLS